MFVNNYRCLLTLAKFFKNLSFDRIQLIILRSSFLSILITFLYVCKHLNPYFLSLSPFFHFSTTILRWRQFLRGISSNNDDCSSSSILIHLNSSSSLINIQIYLNLKHWVFRFNRPSGFLVNYVQYKKLPKQKLLTLKRDTL